MVKGVFTLTKAVIKWVGLLCKAVRHVNLRAHQGLWGTTTLSWLGATKTKQGMNSRSKPYKWVLTEWWLMNYLSLALAKWALRCQWRMALKWREEKRTIHLTSIILLRDSSRVTITSLRIKCPSTSSIWNTLEVILTKSVSRTLGASSLRESCQAVESSTSTVTW